MKKTLSGLTILAVAALGSAQTPAVVYDFNDTLNEYFDRDGFALPLEHRQGNSVNGPATTALTYATELVGPATKRVANFSDAITGQEDFFRCEHGILPNGGATAVYVNEYSIMMDVKITSVGDWISFFNTNASNANDGDAFINPSDGLGISGSYQGAFPRNQWNRVVITYGSPEFGTGTMNIYVNGVLQNTIVTGGFEGRFALYSRTDPDGFRHVDILADEDGDSGAGQISHLAMFDKVLSQDEVSKFSTPGTYSVSGTVDLNGYTGTLAGSETVPLTFEWFDAAGTTLLHTQTATVTPVAGVAPYTVNPPASLPTNVVMKVSGATWLKRKQNVNLSTFSVSAGNINLLNGNAVADGVIDLSDYTAIAVAFNALPSSANWDASADLNKDGVVDLTDYTTIAVNFNAVGE